MRVNRILGCLTIPALMGTSVFAQTKPNLSGTWELVEIEREGNRLAAGKTFKETQIWVHQDPKLNVKILTFDETLGYRTLDLAFTLDGKPGKVGSRTQAGGPTDPVNGSAHWEGNRLVYEQEMPNARNGVPRRIIRSCTLEKNGSEMVMDQVYWMAGTNQKFEDKWHWKKKPDQP